MRDANCCLRRLRSLSGRPSRSSAANLSPVDGRAPGEPPDWRYPGAMERSLVGLPSLYLFLSYRGEPVYGIVPALSDPRTGMLVAALRNASLGSLELAVIAALRAYHPHRSEMHNNCQCGFR